MTKDDSMNKRILIVEDEVIISLDLKLTVESLGHSVIGMAISGENAIKLATELSPDLILMDIFIKGDLTGLEVADKIKNLNIPIIYVTANSNQDIIGKINKITKYGYVSKPFDKEKIKKVFNE
ncbi:MAG: response regulator [Methanobacteriaceae archaeon]|nr:response regulator [Methanobacteriaceae archaeon]